MVYRNDGATTERAIAFGTAEISSEYPKSEGFTSEKKMEGGRWKEIVKTEGDEDRTTPYLAR